MSRRQRHSITFRSANRGALLSARWRPRASAPRAAVLARRRAEAELAELYRERDMQRAGATERDPAAWLQ